MKSYFVYSKNHNGGVTECFSADSRYKCEKYLKQLRQAGRMTHFYIISQLDQYQAKRRYSINA